MKPWAEADDNKQTGAHDYVFCPECGAPVIHESGCVTCPVCVWSIVTCPVCVWSICG